jgi:hypothetical protein
LVVELKNRTTSFDAASHGFPGRRLVYVFIRGFYVPFVNQHGKIPGQPESHDLQELWEYFAGLSNLAFLRLCGLELIHFRDWFLQPVTSLSQLIIDVSKATASIPSARDMMYTDYDNTQVAIGNNISIMRTAAIGNAVDQLHRLKSLTLHVYVASSFVLSLLEESPLLESFDLDLHPKGYRTIQDNSDPTLKRVRANAVVPSHLRDLKLAHITEQEQVLEYMRAPRLRKLCVTDLRTRLSPLIHSCIEGSYRTLQQLNLRGYFSATIVASASSAELDMG